MKFLRVFLRSSAGEIELDTKGHRAPFALLDGARGLGLPERSVDSTPTPAGSGSVLRSQRFDESEVVLPIAVRDTDATAVSLRTRELEKILVPSSDEAVELVVEAPMLGTTRRRKVHYLEGLEGAIGGADSHITWRHSSVKFTALDPMWYGEVREIIQRVDPGRKPFLTERPKLKPGAQVHKESRVPTSSDAGSDGDVWFVGANAEPEKVLRRNLVKNPSFENDLIGWNPGTRVTLGAVSIGGTVSVGSRSAEFKFPTGGTNATTAMRIYRDVNEPVVPGQWVAISALARRGVNAQAGLEAQLYAEFATSGGTYVSRPMSAAKKLTTDSMEYAPDSPNRRTFVVQVPSGVGLLTSPGIRFQADGDMAKVTASDYGYMDAWQIAIAASQGEAENAIATYFDGDTPPNGKKKYRWVGAPHASTSEEYTEATAYTPTDKYVHNGTEWEHVGLEKRAPFFPIILSSSTVQGAYKIEIQGDGNAWPTWLVDGPGEDLLIENIDTNERIFITGTFDERVTINTHPTVADITSETFQDGQLWDRVSTDTELFPLRPGLNRIKITMVNSRPNSMVKIGYSETWLAGW